MIAPADSQKGSRDTVVNTLEKRGSGQSSTAAYVMDVYFDYACPFAWAAQVWLDDVAETLGDTIEVNWRFFPLEQANAEDPDFKVWEQPNDGTSSTLRSFQAAWCDSRARLPCTLRLRKAPRRGSQPADRRCSGDRRGGWLD